MIEQVVSLRELEKKNEGKIAQIPVKARMLFVETERVGLSSSNPEYDSLNGKTIHGAIVTRRSKRRTESTLSSGSWSCRSSTSSSSSICSEGEHFSRYALPIELELSIMGTVDQSLLDRAQVALVKRSKSFEVRRSLGERQKAATKETRVDNEGTFTTTLCSTEL